MFSSDFMHVLSQRGFIHQCTDEAALDALAARERIGAYIGFDCTADSLHVGSLLQIMMLRWLQAAGHRPIVLLGGGTTKIGDPSGRDEARSLLGADAITANKKGIRRSFDPFLSFGDGPGDALLVDNADWLDALGYIPLLRDIGAHFSINRMLTFESVRRRLDREQPLSFLEFNYMILQAYDFLELARRVDCRLQMGGSDQWGNIVNGVDLARRIDGRQLYGLTSPLITAASGAKMGKTAQGAVWLNPDRLSAYDYWQYWRNTDDADVGRFMRFFTELPLDEIARHEALQGAELNESKKLLANEATRLCRGVDAAANAAETARQTFEVGAAGADLPVKEIPRGTLEAGIAANTVFQEAGLCESRGAARRLIRGGGARINDKVVESELYTVGPDDVGADGRIKLSAGKKRHVLIRPA